MHIKPLLLAITCLDWSLVQPAMAEEMAHDHSDDIFHMFRSETDYGSDKNGTVASWDVQGWIGTDDDKLYLKTEDEYKDGKLETAETWALYSRNVSTFWDAQAGIRYDVRPRSISYLACGFNGLAPYYFETEAHIFISSYGHISGRLREENDFLLTQKLILQPYAEVHFYLQDAPENDAGAGIGDGTIGLQTRYEFTRKFAPYMDVHYGRKFGKTASIAKNNGEDKDELVGAVGLRLMF